jgi:hypothetical protein
MIILQKEVEITLMGACIINTQNNTKIQEKRNSSRKWSAYDMYDQLHL